MSHVSDILRAEIRGKSKLDGIMVVYLGHVNNSQKKKLTFYSHVSERRIMQSRMAIASREGNKALLRNFLTTCR